MSAVCRHGGLRRQCETCDLAEECQALEAALAREKADSARLLSERVYSEAECAQLRADVARLTAQNGELGDMISMMDSAVDYDGGRIRSLEAEVARYKEQAAKGTGYVLAQINEDLRPGGKHDHCEYFVLDLDHDKHAPAALLAYATSCAHDYPMLASDLLAIVARMSQPEEPK